MAHLISKKTMKKETIDNEDNKNEKKAKIKENISIKKKESNKLKFEIRRKTFHILIGIILIFLIYRNMIDAEIIFFILIFGIILSLICRKYEIPVISKALKFFDRKENMKKFPGKGAIFFFIGVLLAVKLFPKDIALASIAILTIGDSLSHIFGLYFGKTKNFFGNGEKMLEGTIFGMLFGFLAAILFVVWYEALIASIIAMIAEAVEFELNKNPVDDNVVVPLVSGTVMILIRMYR